MRSRGLIFLITGLYILVFSNLSLASATEVDSEKSDSAINITLKEKTLFLDEVSTLQFEPAMLTGEQMKLTPTNDFVVTISDQRLQDRSPWTLYYSLSFFLNEDQEMIKDQQLSIGQGTIDSLPTDSYEAYDLNIGSENIYPMLKITDPTVGLYKYYISKDKLSLSLNGQTKSGNYTAKQTLLLATLPESQ